MRRRSASGGGPTDPRVSPHASSGAVPAEVHVTPYAGGSGSVGDIQMHAVKSRADTSARQNKTFQVHVVDSSIAGQIGPDSSAA